MLSSNQIYNPNNTLQNGFLINKTLTKSTLDKEQQMRNRQNILTQTYLNNINILRRPSFYSQPYNIRNSYSNFLENTPKNNYQNSVIIPQYSPQNQIPLIQQEKLSYSPNPQQLKPRQSVPLSLSPLRKNNLNLNNKQIPQCVISKESFDIISAYGYNSCNGIVREYNEDKVKIIVGFKIKKETSFFDFFWNNQPKISYFGLFDGHGGAKCSEYLQNNFHNYIFNSSFFPTKPMNAIYDAFKNWEKDFQNLCYKNGVLYDNSGSCALIALILNNTCYMVNLGDSRALYSYNKGKQLFQITNDHKPENPKEKERILKNGGQVYKADFLEIDGKKISFKNVNFGPGFKFPYRLLPGKLSVSFLFLIKNFFFIIFFNQVSRTIGDIRAKNKDLGGKPGVVIADPCITVFDINENSDFILLGCKIYYNYFF